MDEFLKMLNLAPEWTIVSTLWIAFAKSMVAAMAKLSPISLSEKAKGALEAFSARLTFVIALILAIGTMLLMRWNVYAVAGSSLVLIFGFMLFNGVFVYCARKNPDSGNPESGTTYWNSVFSFLK